MSRFRLLRAKGRRRAKLLDQCGQAAALDELHGVVADAALFADGMHGYDVLVPQVRRGQRLVLEALQLPGVNRRSEWQHLQSDLAPQRDLLGFIDHTHSTATDLSQQDEVAKLT